MCVNFQKCHCIGASDWLVNCYTTNQKCRLKCKDSTSQSAESCRQAAGDSSGDRVIAYNKIYQINNNLSDFWLFLEKFGQKPNLAEKFCKYCVNAKALS